MTEALNGLSLGVIHLLGIIFPGLMLFILFIVTACLPYMFLLQKLFPDSEVWIGWATLNSFMNGNTTVIVIAGFILSYILGYIIWLTTVDNLDILSAKKILKKKAKEYAKSHNGKNEEKKDLMYAALEEEGWPYRGDPTDKFPYLHLKGYLEKRGLPNLAKLVTWSRRLPLGGEADIRRSKTIINYYKLEVISRSAILSSKMEAYEAHVRLIFGTWWVAKLFWKFALIAVAVLMAISGINRWTNLINVPFLLSHLSSVLFLEFFLTIILFWIKHRIECQFHHIRLRELVEILACTNLVKENSK